MRTIRLLVIAVGCTIGGPVLIYRSFAELPQLEELTELSGEVEVDIESRRSRWTTSHYPVLRLSSVFGRYKYLDWFPRADQLPEVLHDGDLVTIWTDAGQNNWVWQIERDGRQIVSYQEVKDAVIANGRFDVYLGLGVFALGLTAAFFVYRSYKTPAST